MEFASDLEAGESSAEARIRRTRMERGEDHVVVVERLKSEVADTK